MHRRTNPKIFSNSYELCHNLTGAENKLWQILPKYQLNNVHFRCHHAIGPYIVDFCAPRQKLIIELDGGQHLERQKYDDERTTCLESKGYRVLRFWNNDVMNNKDGVLQVIFDAIDLLK